MSSKRRLKDQVEPQDVRRGVDDEKAPVRAAWRATWSGNTNIVIQSRPFSTITGIILVLYCSVFALMRFETLEGTTAVSSPLGAHFLENILLEY